MSWEYSALLYTPLILIREGAGRGGTQGRPEMGRGAGLASGRLTFSPGADTLIDRLCHGSVIHSCLSYTHRTHTHVHPSRANTRHIRISTPEHKTGTLHQQVLRCVSSASVQIFLCSKFGSFSTCSYKKL